MGLLKKKKKLFDDALNTFYLRLYGVRYIVKPTQIGREETCCHHIGYSFRGFFYMHHPTDRITHVYHGLCYTSRRALAGTRNSLMGPSWRMDPTTHRTMSERSYHGVTSCSQSTILMTPVINWVVCLAQKVLVVTLLEDSERERRGCSGLTSTHWAFKNPLWVGDGVEMRTQYLPAH